MIYFNKRHFTFISVFLVLFTFENALAKKKGGKGAFAGGSISVGLGIAVATAEQDGLNQLIQAAKVSNSATAGDLSAATEYMGHVTFRFSNNLVAIQIRPSYFSQNSSGSGNDGSYDYSLSGLSVFPLIRIIPLSNDLIDFYMQFGLGYGNISGSIKNGARTVDFKGGNFGSQFGIGADFCFLPDHCFGIEGNYRYLPIPRNIVTSASGALPAGVTQATTERELEDASFNDVATKLSGISGLLMYTFNF